MNKKNQNCICNSQSDLNSILLLVSSYRCRQWQVGTVRLWLDPGNWYWSTLWYLVSALASGHMLPVLYLAYLPSLQRSQCLENNPLKKTTKYTEMELTSKISLPLKSFQTNQKYNFSVLINVRAICWQHFFWIIFISSWWTVFKCSFNKLTVF